MRKVWQELEKAYDLLRILSIDVALGAVAMSYLWAAWLLVSPSLTVYIILGLTVWLIYTTDHLLDAYQIKHIAHTQRHQFHQKHFKLLCWSAALVCLLVLGFLFLLSWQVWWWGSLALAWALLHFLLSFFLRTQQYLLLQKELRIAIGYSLGVAVGIFADMPFAKVEWISTVWLLVFVAGLAWYNLLLIAYFEFESDVKDAQISLAVSLGLPTLQTLLRRLSVALLMYFMVGCYFLLPSFQYQIFILLALMLLTLELIRRFERYFEQKERYRIWADAIFLYPLILWILQ